MEFRISFRCQLSLEEAAIFGETLAGTAYICCESHHGTAMAPRPRNAVRTSVILPEEAHARIQALASANDVSAAWVIRHAVLKFLDEHGNQTELPLRLPTKKAIGQ
jgi:hypothetical protein